MTDGPTPNAEQLKLDPSSFQLDRSNLISMIEQIAHFEELMQQF
jgi:hypothetical protein